MEIPTVEWPVVTAGPTEWMLMYAVGILVVVLALLFGVVSAVVAAGKGRSGCGWLAIGFLLGPLGLILASVVPANQAALERRAVRRGEMQYCPYCAESIRAEAVKCRYCGERFGGNQPPDTAYMRRPSV